MLRPGYIGVSYQAQYKHSKLPRYFFCTFMLYVELSDQLTVKTPAMMIILLKADHPDAME